MIRLILLVVALIPLWGCTPRNDADTPVSGLITIYSTTDSAVFQPVIEDFSKLHPELRLRYVELDAQPLFDRFLAESDAQRPQADILLSSAIDLQVKLVNDGFAQPHSSASADKLPNWARWRSEIFGLTFEPVVMLANPDQFGGRPIPRSRLQLVEAMRADPKFWQGKLGTYDITASSVGYLLAGQDARLSSEYGALIEAMGDTRTRTYQNVSVLIDDLAAGRIALGYNVLGSYAKRRIAEGARLRVIYPEDYTLAVVRAAFVAKNAPNPAGAHLFLEYLMSLRGQRVLATRSDLSAVREEIDGPYGRLGLSGAAIGPLRPIPIGPGLLTYLDRQKRERFLQNWRGALNNGD